MSEIVQCFLNADLRCGHDGLAAMAKKHGIQVKKLDPGQYVVFINAAKNRLKLYAASNVIAYLKLTSGRIDLGTIAEIPKAFRASGRIDYDAALKESVTKSLLRARKAGPLEVYAAGKNAGVM